MTVWRREVAEPCELVGEEMASLVGDGIIAGFAGQAALSLALSAWVFFLTTHGNMDITYPEGSVQREIERKRLEFVSNILMIGSDIQSTLGIAYMITVFSQTSIMDTYHLHLVFDIVSFVGLSNTAALICWRFCRAKIEGPESQHSGHLSKRIPERISFLDRRYRATLVYTILYLALTILLCVRLHQWAPDQEPGRCYFSHLVTSPNASHPSDDQIYVSITASWLIVIILSSVFAGVSSRRWILIFAFFHFPLHLYMATMLRQANQGKFEGEKKHEHDWDFGQTTAVLLLGIAVVELITKGKEYREFERYAAKHGMSRHPSERSLEEVEEGNTNSYLLGTTARDENPSEGRCLSKERRRSEERHSSEDRRSSEERHPSIEGHPVN